MILILSDIHFGEHTASFERAKEQALLSCLHYYQPSVEALYLVGDVYHCYLEYRHLIPRGFVRFQATLAHWHELGIPVYYLLGNHDPWHLSYFKEELGVQIIPEQLLTTHYQHRLLFTHGDRLLVEEGFRHTFKGWIRKPWVYALYRGLLPADTGIALAHLVSKRFGKKELDGTRIVQLREKAKILLQRHAIDGVIMGHSHAPALEKMAHGFYLNPGYWGDEQTYALLDRDHVQLCRWQEKHPEVLQTLPLQ